MHEAESFKEQFLRETLFTERLRTSVLAALLMLVLVSLLVLYAFARTEYTRIFQSESPIYLVSLVIVLAVLYELLVRFFVTRQIAAQRTPPTGLRYVNAFLEVSLPTVLLAVVATTVNPLYVLSGPAASTYFVFIVLSTLRLDFRLSVFTGAAAAFEYVILALAHLRLAGDLGEVGVFGTDLHYFGKGVMFLAVGIAAGFVGLQIKNRVIRSLETIKERNDVISLFGQQVSQAIVDELLREKALLSSKKRTVCVMFLDIRNFTPLVERKSPEEVVSYLNALFGFMIEIINRHYGIINQFLGDGFMATFGAPLSHGNDARNAVEAALEIVSRVQHESESGNIQPTKVGIGLHVGEAITGNVGSSLRKQYSITGDVVILASRIEQLNKDYQSQLLISEEILEASGIHRDAATPLGPVPVKGIENPISLYRLA